MAEIPEGPEDEFKGVIRTFLNTPPLPMAGKPRRREPKAPEALSEEARLPGRARNPRLVVSRPNLATDHRSAGIVDKER